MIRTKICVLAALVGLAFGAPTHAIELCSKLDKKTGDVKDGASVKFRSECKKKKDGTPTEGPVGTTVSFAQATLGTNLDDTDKEIEKLTDPSAGGALTVSTSVRIVLTGAVTIGNQAGNGEFSVIACQFQVSDDGGPFDFVGVPSGTESIGNSNHDEKYSVPLVAVVDRPAGVYDGRIVCRDTFASAGSLPVVRAASFSAVSTPF
jgi:hypothetical protein